MLNGSLPYRDGLPVAFSPKSGQIFSNRISMAPHLQSSITICQRMVDFEAVSRHLLCSVWWNIPMEFSQHNSMVFWGQECQEDCLGGWSKAASWIGEFLPQNGGLGSGNTSKNPLDSGLGIVIICLDRSSPSFLHWSWIKKRISELA